MVADDSWEVVRGGGAGACEEEAPKTDVVAESNPYANLDESDDDSEDEPCFTQVPVSRPWADDSDDDDEEGGRGCAQRV